MNAPATTVTNFILAFECAVFAWLLAGCRDSYPALRRSLTAFFAALAMAALLGGLVHGFLAEQSPLRALCWRATLLAMGVGALAGCRVAALAVVPRAAPAISAGAAMGLLWYARAVSSGDDGFGAAVAFTLPASVFLLVAFMLRGTSGRGRLAALGLAGVIGGGALQQAHVGLSPRFFDHNALYHVVQIGALFLVFLGARDVVGTGRTEREVTAC